MMRLASPRRTGASLLDIAAPGPRTARRGRAAGKLRVDRSDCIKLTTRAGASRVRAALAREMYFDTFPWRRRPRPERTGLRTSHLGTTARRPCPAGGAPCWAARALTCAPPPPLRGPPRPPPRRPRGPPPPPPPCGGPAPVRAPGWAPGAAPSTGAWWGAGEWA